MPGHEGARPHPARGSPLESLLYLREGRDIECPGPSIGRALGQASGQNVWRRKHKKGGKPNSEAEKETASAGNRPKHGLRTIQRERETWCRKNGTLANHSWLGAMNRPLQKVMFHVACNFGLAQVMAVDDGFVVGVLFHVFLVRRCSRICSRTMRLWMLRCDCRLGFGSIFDDRPLMANHTFHQGKQEHMACNPWGYQLHLRVRCFPAI